MPDESSGAVELAISGTRGRGADRGGAPICGARRRLEVADLAEQGAKRIAVEQRKSYLPQWYDKEKTRTARNAQTLSYIAANVP